MSERRRLKALEIGRDYYNRSGNLIHFAVAENNLSQLYKAEGRYNAAHEAIDRATRLFKKAKDSARVAYSLDTKALIFYAERRFAEALAAATAAVEHLRKSENIAYLCDSLVTRSKIHLNLSDFSASVLDLTEAVSLCRQQSGDAAAMKYIAEFEEELDLVRSAKDAAKPDDSADLDNLRLIMPAALTHFDDIRGIWIRNRHLESRGLMPGMLAIVAACDVKKGDLVAVSHLATEEISCGIYDFDFGIVCLETDGDPLLFNSDEVKVIGKIVGVCDSKTDNEGRLTVEPIA